LVGSDGGPIQQSASEMLAAQEFAETLQAHERFSRREPQGKRAHIKGTKLSGIHPPGLNLREPVFRCAFSRAPPSAAQPLPSRTSKAPMQNAQILNAPSYAGEN